MTDIEEICYIREAFDSEQGWYVVCVDSTPLTTGFKTEDEAIRFCQIVMGASCFSRTMDRLICTRFDNMKKYRVSNAYNIDEDIKAKSRESKS